MGLDQFASDNPALLAGLTGAGIGGLVGGFGSDEGQQTRGAVQGALLGGGVGAVTGLMADRGREIMEKLTPNQARALLIGGAAGGLYAGGKAKAKLAPWVVERLAEARAENGNNKEAYVTQQEQQEKQAEEAITARRLKSFDAGVEIYCAEQGIDKAAFAQALGVDEPGLLAPTMILELQALQEQGQ